jgi:hypothetical protein
MSTLQRRVFFGDDIVVSDEVSAEKALEITTICDANFDAHVSKFTQLRVHVTTPAVHSRTEYIGQFSDLYPIVAALKHRRKPEPKKGPTSREVAAAMLVHH